MSIIGLLLLILIILMLTGAMPGAAGDARGLLWTVLVILLIVWIVLALFGPLSYPVRGWTVWP